MFILKKLFDKTNEPFTEIEESFSGGGTGVSTSIKRNWEEDKGDGVKRKDFMKMTWTIGNNFHVASAVAVDCNGSAAESPMFPQLLKDTASHYDVEEVCLDAAYLSRENCSLIAKLNAVSFIYAKKNITFKRRGFTEWNKIHSRLVKNPQEWLRSFYRRENSESAISVKEKFPKPVRGKTDISKVTEVYVRVCCYNVTRVLKAYFTHNVQVKELEHSYL